MFVDSSGWIAFFSRCDSHHREAAALVRSAVEEKVPLATTNLVVAETHRLLLFRVGIAAAARALDVFDRSADLTVHFPASGDHGEARSWIAKFADRKVTYTDATSFAVMRRLACPAFIGFDGDFDAAGFNRWQP